MGTFSQISPSIYNFCETLNDGKLSKEANVPLLASTYLGRIECVIQKTEDALFSAFIHMRIEKIFPYELVFEWSQKKIADEEFSIEIDKNLECSLYRIKINIITEPQQKFIKGTIKTDVGEEIRNAFRRPYNIQGESVDKGWLLYLLDPDNSNIAIGAVFVPR